VIERDAHPALVVREQHGGPREGAGAELEAHAGSAPVALPGDPTDEGRPELLERRGRRRRGRWRRRRRQRRSQSSKGWRCAGPRGHGTRRRLVWLPAAGQRPETAVRGAPCGCPRGGRPREHELPQGGDWIEHPHPSAAGARRLLLDATAQLGLTPPPRRLASVPARRASSAPIRQGWVR
jgi:hypothetical protein